VRGVATDSLLREGQEEVGADAAVEGKGEAVKDR